jgi:hypothetical protein
MKPRRGTTFSRRSLECRPANGRYKSLTDVVRDYRARFAERADRELRYFEIQPTLREAVRCAGLATGPSGKRFAHQRRIPGGVLREAEALLQFAAPKLRRAQTFEELHISISDTVGDIRGIGELTVYDTALRIGAYLRLAPREVFLHAGVRAGARALRLNDRGETLRQSDLPRALRRVTPAQAEDILCIYERHLARLADERAI